MSQFAGKRSRAQAEATQSRPANQHVSGRRTLVEQTYGSAPETAVDASPSAPVQRKGGSGSDVHAQAAAGTAGPGGQLPFLDLIQRAFGGHDVSGVRAHTGGAAAEANEAMGSQAFARGNDVAFGGAPDLHTAAHEAAHVVQQRAGVHLKGGVGEAGDPYERHADAVADTVVAGGSAEALLSTMAGPPGGGAAASGGGEVQHQRRGLDGGVEAEPAPNGGTSTSDTSASGQPAGGQPGPETPTPLQRVQALNAASDLPALLALQRELLQQRRGTPATRAHRGTPATPAVPPNTGRDVFDALAEIRHRIMDRIAEIRISYEPRISAASTGASTGTDNTAAVEALETSMDTDCTPYLDGLMEGDPQNRYSHTNNAVSEQVFAAVRLHSARRGVGRIGHRVEAEAEARRRGGVGDDEWCGAFAYTQAAAGGGMDPHWASYMAGERGIRTALTYGGVLAHTWIWVNDRWEGLEQHHRLRNSARRYVEIQQGPPSDGIQPGDIVLIDNNFGMDPDHITTAVSFDGRYLNTVGGNQGSGEAGVSRTRFDLQENPAPNDIRRTNERGARIRERDPRRGPKHVRVHGIGRWSIADYERHVYSTATTMPTSPPSAATLARLGR